MYHERQQLQRCLLHTLNNLLQRPAWSVASLNALCDTIHASRTRWVGNYDANVLAAALQQHGLEVQWHDSRDTQLTSLDLTGTHADKQKGEDTDRSAAPAQQQPTVLSQPPKQHDKRGGAQQQSQQQLQSHHQQSKQQQDQQPQHLQSHEQPQQQHRHQQPQQQRQQDQQPQPQQHKQEEQLQEQQQELVGLVLNVAGGGLLSRLLGGRHWLAIRRLQGAWWNLDSQLPQPVRFGTDAAADAAATCGTECLRAYLRQQLAAGAHLLLVTRPAGSCESSDSGGIAEPAALVGS